MPKITASLTAVKSPRRPRCEPVYRVRNWAAYEAGLKQRGSLTFWITPQALRGWASQPCCTSWACWTPRPTERTIFTTRAVHELDERALTELHRDHIGFVFQSYHLIDELTVSENLETPLLYQKVKGAERKGRIAEMLDRFNIIAKKDLFPSQLSGGQQQLVGIARALITQPKLILADEPTGNLNSTEGERIMAQFKQLNAEGITIIQCTHSEKNAAYGDRIVSLSDGWIDSDERL